MWKLYFFQIRSTSEGKEVVEIPREKSQTRPAQQQTPSPRTSQEPRQHQSLPPNAQQNGGEHIAPVSRFYFGMNGGLEPESTPSLPTAVGKVKENQTLAQPFRKPR